VSYPKEVWVEMLSRLGIAENVLVEIPLPGHVSNDWDGVFNALIEAKRYFDRAAPPAGRGAWPPSASL
jgi:hypothetical protein